MTKKIISYRCCGLALLIVVFANSSGHWAAEQSQKPSQTLREVKDRQREVFEKFEREVSDGKKQPYEWEEQSEELRRFSAERAARYKISDWKGEELLALATLYQLGEQFGPAADAYRSFLQSSLSPRRAPGGDVRSSLARALIQTEQLEEAEKVLDEMSMGVDGEPVGLTSRISLRKELAIALRDRGQLEKAADQARRGYELADASIRGELLDSRLREFAQRDQFAMAALFVATNERLNRKKASEDFNELVTKYDFTKQPGLRLYYESELTIERLIGNPSPEIAASRWLDENSKTHGERRGKVVLLDFWAMWCSPCVAAFPHLREFQSKFGSKGFEIIGVTKFYGRSDTEDDLSREQEWKSLQEYKRKYQLSYPVAVGKMDDVTNEERFGIISLPTVILIDRSGNIRHIKRGIGDYRKLERQIEKLMDEKQ